MKYRIENDSIGKVNVPINAYFGSQTIRASQNFPISNFIFQKSFINAIVLIKLSAAKANMELKLLNETKAKAIIEASSEIINGKFMAILFIEYDFSRNGIKFSCCFQKRSCVVVRQPALYKYRLLHIF